MFPGHAATHRDHLHSAGARRRPLRRDQPRLRRRRGALPAGFPSSCRCSNPGDVATFSPPSTACCSPAGGDIDPAPLRPAADARGRRRRPRPGRVGARPGQGRASRRDVPLLGVCRGTQVINVALGGTLMQHLPAVSELGHRERGPLRPRSSTRSRSAKGSLLRKVLGARTVGVNSLHHQAIGELGTGVRATALGARRGGRGDRGRRSAERARRPVAPRAADPPEGRNAGCSSGW